MKIKILPLLLAFVIGVAVSSLAADTAMKKTTLRHIVALKFKDGTGAPEIKKVEEAFRALKAKIPQIAALEWGINNSPEQKNKGFTHCFVLTFNTDDDRQAYLPHPPTKHSAKSSDPSSTTSW